MSVGGGEVMRPGDDLLGKPVAAPPTMTTPSDLAVHRPSVLRPQESTGGVRQRQLQQQSSCRFDTRRERSPRRTVPLDECSHAATSDCLEPLS